MFRINHLINSIFLLCLVLLFTPEDPIYFLGLGIWLSLTVLDLLLVFYRPTRLICTRISANKYVVYSKLGKMIVLVEAQIEVAHLLSIYRLTIRNNTHRCNFYFFTRPKFTFDYSPCKNDAFLQLFNDTKVGSS